MPRLTATPHDQPDPERAGYVRFGTAEDPVFYHYCVECGRDAGFGFGCDPAAVPPVPGRWYCDAHRAEGQRWWRERDAVR